jgi:hypothetical protein
MVTDSSKLVGTNMLNIPSVNLTYGDQMVRLGGKNNHKKSITKFNDQQAAT